MATKYLVNGHFQFLGPSKYPEMGIFGVLMYHLATLLISSKGKRDIECGSKYFLDVVGAFQFHEFTF
jgi:hypothetical protein